MKNILNYSTQAEFAAAEENGKYVTSVVPGVAYVKENGKIGYNGREYIARIGYYRYLDNLPYDTPVTFGVQRDDSSYREFVEITSFTQNELEIEITKQIFDYCVNAVYEYEPYEYGYHIFCSADVKLFDAEWLENEFHGWEEDGVANFNIFDYDGTIEPSSIKFSDKIYDNQEIILEVVRTSPPKNK